MPGLLDALADALRAFLRFCYRNQNLLFVVGALATLAVLAVISGYWFFYRGAYVLAGLIGVCFVWARIHAGGLEVRVDRASDRLQVGQEAEARVRLRSRSSVTKV